MRASTLAAGLVSVVALFSCVAAGTGARGAAGCRVRGPGHVPPAKYIPLRARVPIPQENSYDYGVPPPATATQTIETDSAEPDYTVTGT